MPEPLVTVLMAVFRDRQFIDEAVSSILNQSFGDFEFVVVDDASPDGSGDAVAAIGDPRIRLLRNRTNVGLTRSLVLGLQEARGRFVARMDADDVSDPTRLARQLSFLERHPEIGVVGTCCVLVDEDGRETGSYDLPLTDAAIRWHSLLFTPFAHPSVMLRRAVIDRHGLTYDPAFRTAQDYDLWVRLLMHTRGANLPERLLRYRVRAGITQTSRSSQQANRDAISLRTIRQELPHLPISSADSQRLRAIVGWDQRDSETDARRGYLLARYAQMLGAYSRRHQDAPGWKDVHRAELKRLAYLLYRYPGAPGTLATVSALLRAAAS